MKVEDKGKLNNPLKGWQVLNAISSMVFHTVNCATPHLLLKNMKNVILTAVEETSDLYPFLAFLRDHSRGSAQPLCSGKKKQHC